jgi:hypothetical protein
MSSGDTTIIAIDADSDAVPDLVIADVDGDGVADVILTDADVVVVDTDSADNGSETTTASTGLSATPGGGVALDENGVSAGAGVNDDLAGAPQTDGARDAPPS